MIIISLLVVICSSSVIAVFNIYPSPLVCDTNRQLTQMESKGTEWFLENREISIPMVATDYLISKNEIYYFGFDQYNLYKEQQISDKIPPHFGYDKNDTMTKTFKYKNVYMIITECNKIAYLALPENARAILSYSKQDFEKINLDSAVSKIYSNREFEVWFI